MVKKNAREYEKSMREKQVAQQKEWAAIVDKKEHDRRVKQEELF